MILMCKDNPVYDIDKNTVINESLMPGAMLNKESFGLWVGARKTVLSNAIARRLRFNAFGYSAEEAITKRTHMLSLSDCYWIKHEGEDVRFEQISPYYIEFWSGLEGAYDEGPIPTLYTNGARDKYWVDAERLFKAGCEIEIEAYKLAEILEIPCNKIEKHKSGNHNGVIVHNITNENVMLESARCSGVIKDEVFATIDEIIENFGDDGLTMMSFDAITGNIDRHVENFGYLRDANTGEYLGMAPLYDFDQILKASVMFETDHLLQSIPVNDITENLCRKTIELSEHSTFVKRAMIIMEKHFNKNPSTKEGYMSKINKAMADNEKNGKDTPALRPCSKER